MLDLEARAVGDGFVRPPRPSNFRRRSDAIGLLPGERIDDLLNLGHPIDWGDEDRVANGDHRDLVHSDGGDKRTTVAPQQRIRGIYREDIASRHIAVAILASK